MVTSAFAEPQAIPLAAAPLAEAPIDHVLLARYTCGNRALEIEVLQLFAEQAPQYLEGLRTADSEKAWRDAAHTLKGSARAVGAVRLADLAAQVEALCPTPNSAARQCAVALLAEAVGEARAHIDALAADG